MRCMEENGDPKTMNFKDQNFPQESHSWEEKRPQSWGHQKSDLSGRKRCHKSLMAYLIAKSTYPYYLAFV